VYLVTIGFAARDTAVCAIRRFAGDADGNADKNPTEDTTERQILDEYVIA